MHDRLLLLPLGVSLFLAACSSAPKADGPPDLVDGGDDAEADDGADGEPGTDGGDDGADGGDGGDPEVVRPTYDECFADLPAGASFGLDYDQFSPVLGTHCSGTDHQNIVDIERVVFLGDSITVGSPPAGPEDFYRSRLADTLADRYSLTPPDDLWKLFDVTAGTALMQESGDFAACAKWGARTDDLMRDNDQVLTCLPEESRDKRTLVIITMGGNDLFSLTEGFIEGEDTDQLWEDTREFVQLMDDAVTWIKAPGRFPNGVHVVFTNLYEFTDGTGDTRACPAATLAGFGAAVTDPALEEMVLWASEQYMRIAVDNGADMVFLLEQFCGHGYARDDEDGRCYRGPEAELWFDETCFHPNDRGHEALADFFLDVVAE